MDEEVSSLQEGEVFSDLVDGITAITQNSLLTVDVGDFRLGGSGVHKAIVQRGQASLLGQRRQIDGGNTLSSMEDRKFNGLTAIGKRNDVAGGH